MWVWNGSLDHTLVRTAGALSQLLAPDGGKLLERNDRIIQLSRSFDLDMISECFVNF